MKQISMNQVKLLKEHGYIREGSNGLVNRKGYRIGYHKTPTKRYVEDYYAEVAIALQEQAG